MILRYMAATVITLGTIALCGAAGLTGTWLADRSLPVSVNRVELITPEVKPGETLQIKFTVLRHRSCEFHADRFLYSSTNQREVLEDVDMKAAPGPLGENAYTTMVDVPKVFTPGPARYISVGFYRCNLIHHWWLIPGRDIDVTFAVLP